MKRSSIIITALLLAGTIHSQVIRRIDNGTADALNTAINSRFTSAGLTGLSVGIIYGGEIVYTNAWGFAKTSLPFTTTTKTVIASVSKTITGIMAMRMRENGDLAINNTIDNYIGFDGGDQITIRHLLSHQSGIGHYDNCGGGYDGQFDWLTSYLVVSGCSRCVTPPGSETLYTTFGTTLLGAIIEKEGLDVYGKNYRQLYNDWIRTPGGLTTMTPAFDDSDPLLADGHSPGGNTLTRGWKDIGWRLPAGGFISDIDGLAGYARGIIQNTFITATSLDLMSTVQTESGTPDVSCGTTTSPYGLAFRVNSSGDDIRISHNGESNHGYCSLLYLYPKLGAGIVLLCNNENQAGVLGNIITDVEDLILCPDNRDFTSAVNWNAPLVFEAAQTINCNAPVTTSSGTVVFDAGKAVILKPGFEVTGGRVFRAVVEGCQGSTRPF